MRNYLGMLQKRFPHVLRRLRDGDLFPDTVEVDLGDGKVAIKTKIYDPELDVHKYSPPSAK